MIRKTIFFMAIAASFAPVTAHGDSIKLKDGTTHSGTIIKQNDSMVMIEGEEGMRAFNMSQVAEVEKGGETQKAVAPVASEAKSSGENSQYFSRIPAHWTRLPEGKTPGAESYTNGHKGVENVAVAMNARDEKMTPMQWAQAETNPLTRVASGSELVSGPEQKGRYTSYVVRPYKKNRDLVLAQYLFPYKNNQIFFVGVYCGSLNTLEKETAIIEDFLDSYRF